MQTRKNVLKSLKLILVARFIESSIMVYQLVSKMPEATVGTERRGNVFYIGVNLIAASNSRYHFYAIDLS